MVDRREITRRGEPPRRSLRARPSALVGMGTAIALTPDLPDPLGANGPRGDGAVFSRHLVRDKTIAFRRKHGARPPPDAAASTRGRATPPAKTHPGLRTPPCDPGLTQPGARIRPLPQVAGDPGMKGQPVIYENGDPPGVAPLRRGAPNAGMPETAAWSSMAEAISIGGWRSARPAATGQLPRSSAYMRSSAI